MSTLALLIGVATVPCGAAVAQSASVARGTALFEKGDYAGSRAELEAAVRENPRDAGALYYLGRIAIQEDRSSDAVDLLEKALSVNERVSDYHLYLGAALGSEAQRASKFRAPFLVKRVKKELERAVALDARSVTARLGLVQFYLSVPGFMGGSVEKAHDEVVALSSIDPLEGHMAAAMVAMRQKDTSGVLHEYEAAIAAAPDSSVGYLGLGGAYQRLQRWNDAFATFDRLLKRKPGDLGAHFQIGRTAALSGQSLDRGEQSIKLWLAKPPATAPRVSVAGAHHRLGQIYERTGRRDAARAEFEEAVRINPRNEEARKSLAGLR